MNALIMEIKNIKLTCHIEKSFDINSFALYNSGLYKIVSQEKTFCRKPQNADFLQLSHVREMSIQNLVVEASSCGDIFL